MMIYWSLLIAIVGALVYLVPVNPRMAKVQELGRIAYAFGLLVFLLTAVGGRMVGR